MQKFWNNNQKKALKKVAAKKMGCEKEEIETKECMVTLESLESTFTGAGEWIIEDALF